MPFLIDTMAEITVGQHLPADGHTRADWTSALVSTQHACVALLSWTCVED